MNTTVHLYSTLKERFWFFLAICSIAITAVVLPMLYGNTPDAAHAATITVCASGCDFTTIQSALQDAGTADGDIIQVRTGYVSSTETFPVVTIFDQNITIECEDSSIIIGSPTLNDPFEPPVFAFDFATGTTITNCTFHNASLNPDVDNVTITGNIFTSGTAYYSVIAGANNMEVTSNTGQFGVDFGNSSNVTFEGNTLYTDPVGGSSWPSTNNLIIRNNRFYQTTSNTAPMGQLDDPTDLIIIGNEFLYTSDFVPGDNTAMILNISRAVGSFTLQDNLFVFPPRNSTSSYRGINISRATGDVTLDIQRNTFIGYDDGERILDIGVDGAGTTNLTFSYNLLTTRAGTTALSGGVRIVGDSNDTYTGTVEYNGLYRIGFEDDAVADLINFASSSTLDISNSVLTKPYFKDEDGIPSTDYHLTPYSDYLDVNGTNDIGYYSAARGTSFTIDDDAAIDYVTVHASTTDAIEDNARDGDTWTLAAGTYAPIYLVTSTNRTGENLIIRGTGNGASVIEALPGEFPIHFNGISSTTVRNVIVQGATTADASYILTNAVYSFGGNDYDEEAPFNGGVPANISYIAGAGCGITSYNQLEAGDVSQLVDGTSDWNLAVIDLVGFGGLRLTVWLPDQYHATAGSLETACGFVNVDAFVASAFVAVDGEYTYDSDAVAAAGLTLDSDTPTEPTLSLSVLSGGIILEDSTTNNFVGVTSTGNLYAVSLLGTSNGNVITSSTLQNSTGYDVFSSVTSGSNDFQNVTFTRASSTLSNAGIVNVYYRARAKTQTSSTAAIAGVPVTFESANESASASLTTGVDGFTTYSSYLLAHVLTSSSLSLTNGGYNPYDVTASATSTYSSTSTSQTLSSPDQTVTLTMLEAPSAPSAPSNLTTSTVSTSSLVISWDDNSNDEDGFIIDYNTTNTFPGTTTTVAANTTSTTITGLTENTQYFIRVAAYNGAGTSDYSNIVTSSYTLLDAPTIQAGGLTTNSVQLGLVATGDGTLYQFVNLTDAATTTTSTPDVTFSGLGVNSTQVYRARMLNGDNVPSDWSSDLTVVTLTETPSNLAATGGTESVTLTWTTNSSTSYLIQNVTLGATTTSAGSPSTWSSLTCGTTYTFRIAGLNQLAIASSYSSTVSATTNACPSSGGGGGGAASRNSAPKLDDPTAQLLINNGAAQTSNRTVTLSIPASNAVDMAISNDPSFANDIYVPYQSTATHLLTEGNGEKNVYVKLRSTRGGTITLADSILLTSQSTNQVTTQGQCPLSIQQPYSHPGSPAVYYITENCTKRAFRSPVTYFTYFTSWSAVRQTTEVILNGIADDTLGFMPLGPLYDPASGTLIKTPSNPDVYLLLNGERYLVDDEAAALFQFGTAWASWIEDVDARLIENTPEASMILGTTIRPDGMIVKYVNEARTYQLDDQELRWIPSEAIFNALGFRWDRIVTIPETETYPNGPDLTL